MNLYYDFHIHSALSPCGDNDMTPNNIINMSKLKGLDAIAICDHNSALNVKACVECGEEAGIVVLPGIEVETCEEVHILALFDIVEKALEMGEYISQNLPNIKNRIDIFGNQFVMNKDDEVEFEVKNLLSTASFLDVNTAVKKIRQLKGVAIPAHIDKASYSIISNLGFIPDDLDFSTVEIRGQNLDEAFTKMHKIDEFKTIHNSDAHFLWDINEKNNFLDVKSKNPSAIIDYLSRKLR